MEKKKLVIIFGGQSSEHDISCLSAMNVSKNVDTEKYDMILVGITKEGHWLKCDRPEDIEDGYWRRSKVGVVFSPDALKQCLYLMSEEGGIKKVPVDVVFPVLHGLYGEDGTIQGLLELSKIPYVGCGVLASAVSMDKVFTKLIVDKLKIRQADYVVIRREELADLGECVERIEKKLPYPVFVKPSCAGSSVGVSKAEDRAELEKALLEAEKHDSKILVEETIVGREIECAVLEDGKEIKASGVGEIVSSARFYDFEAKYHSSESRTDTDPEMSEEKKAYIRESAVRIFKAVDGHGLSRVDFFLTKEGVVFNEINTLPGFTSISLFPMLFQKTGYTQKELVSTLIESAFLRKDH